jgi:membrane-associated phospholipid phosphatase
MNIDTLTLQEPVQTGLRRGLTGLAAGTAWARVEGGVHFPSDVLAGAALGNFMGRLFQHAFLGEREGLRLGLYFGGHEALLSLSFATQ